MIVGIVGGRDYGTYEAVVQAWDLFERLRRPITHVVSGGARGVDSYAVDIARARGVSYTEHYPDYNRYGRYDAPKKRNTLIVNDCEELLAIWDGISGGTRDSVEKARALGKPVFYFNPCRTSLTSPRR